MNTATEVVARGKLAFDSVTQNVARISHRIVNSYLVADPGNANWVLVDAGLKTSARHILRAVTERFGDGAKPEAIILTHGHFDHVGALCWLAEHWNVPVYAHRLEMPYLTGRDSYPPADPSVGGGMLAVMSRFFTRGPINLTGRMRALHDDGTVPGLRGWRWIHTPGHSPGHVALFHEHDRLLIAGDAFVTTRQESALAVLSQRQEVNGPPAYFTPDWRLARDSVRLLASLQPRIAATGHGVPMSGEELRKQLNRLAARFNDLAVPRRGRYLLRPALMDEAGVISVPPALPVSRSRSFMLAVGFVVIATSVALLVKQGRRRAD